MEAVGSNPEVIDEDKFRQELEQIRFYIENFDRLCRLCLTNERLVNVYSNVQGRNVFYVRNFIKEAFRLLEQTIDKKDKMPNFICEKCERNLSIIYNFKKKCDQSKRILEKVRDKTIVPEDLLKTEDCPAVDKVVLPSRSKTKDGASTAAEILKKLPLEINIGKVRELPRAETPPSHVTNFVLPDAPLKIEPDEIKQESASLGMLEVNLELKDIEHLVIEGPSLAKDRPESNDDGDEDEGEFQDDRDSDSDWKPDELSKTETRNDATIKKEPSERPKKPPNQHKRKPKQQSLKGHTKRMRNKDKTICSVCGALVGNIKSHMVTHEEVRPHQCEQCSKSFTSRNKLQSHINSVHLRKRDFKCEVCGKAFLEKNNLKGHQRIHKGDRKYKCDLCPKSFLFAGTLRCHQLTHTQDKRHECQICGKMFLMRTTLNKHLYVHSNERPYKCDMCDKCFRTSTHKIVHMRTHTGERPLQCRICGIGFAHHKARSVHMKTKHAEELAALDMLDERGHLKF